MPVTSSDQFGGSGQGGTDSTQTTPHTVAFDTLQRASFQGIEFPITSMTLKGGIRDHIHEYPHAAGGAPEKLGRKLYEVSMQANFQSTFRAYPRLWPSALSKLRKIFEQQTTGDLVIPTIGTIQAYARNWTQQMEAKIRSGETATFEFVEDQGSEDLAAGINDVTDSLQTRFGTIKEQFF